MRVLILIASTALLALPCGSARADCRAKAIAALQASSPDGYVIYRQTSRPDVFRSWIDCSDAQFDLPTAVHESTHLVTGETDAFPLVGGGAIRRPHEVSSFMPPARIAGQFAADDFTSIYLARGKASSSADFLYLLDELNAYAHDLAVAVDLRALREADVTVDHRDGLAALMAFTAAYAEMARASDGDTWRGLDEPQAKATVVTLWAQAERVMASSCGIPNFGANDKAYIRRVCSAGPRSALASILGRAPACPTACLANPPSDVAVEDSEETASMRAPQPRQATDDLAAGELPRHPFAIQAGPRRHRRAPAVPVATDPQ